MKQLVKNAIEDAIKKMGVQAEVEVTNSTGHGDLSSNIIFKIINELKMKPIDISTKIIENIDKEKYQIEKIEFAAPGFLNFYLNKDQKNIVIKKIMKEKDDFGRGDIKKYVNIEFVSANPTGFLHVGHARGAAYGDSLGNIMSFAGIKVDKEYYINDAGMQIKDLGKTTY
jgi:arginyl-tRNA synthetase